MPTFEEKRAVVTELFRHTPGTDDFLEAGKRLYDLLLKDTNNGKLYKYRTFDRKGYSLKNLREGTLHCSKPSAFNDPFDCKIGISITHSVDAIDNKGEMGEIALKFRKIVRGEISLEDCTEEERPVIQEWMKCEELVSLCKVDIDKSEVNEQELFQKHVPIVLESSRSIYGNNVPELMEMMSGFQIQNLVENVSGLDFSKMQNETYDLQMWASDLGINGDYDDLDLPVQIAKQSKIVPTNQIIAAQEGIVEYEKKMAKLADTMLVGCLCTSYKNRLMWSHYANSYKGFCIEYDFGDVQNQKLDTFPFPVLYSKERPLLPCELIVDQSSEVIEKAKDQLTFALLTKDAEWCYENEWRVFVRDGLTPDVRMPRVSCVYLGPIVSRGNRKKIIDIAKEKGFQVKQITLDKGKYELHTVDVKI